MKRKIVGALATARQDRLRARALALTDLRAFTRTCFLGSFIDTNAHRSLTEPIRRDELAAAIGVVRNERFEAWIDLGLALKELGERKDWLYSRGRRLKAIVDGDSNLEGSYRSALQLEASMYHDVVPVLTKKADHTPSWPQTRSYTSLLANAAVAPTIREAALEAPVARFLEVGCHDGVFTRSILRSRPAMTGIAIDSDADLLAVTKQQLNRRGWGSRVETRLQALEQLTPSADGSFGLITLVNQICGVPEDRRRTYLKHAVDLLEPGGFLVVVSLLAGRSVTSASIDFALKAQKEAGALPTLTELDDLLESFELGISHREQVLAGEALYAITAFKGWA